MTAMTTSVRAVLANPRPMLAWAIVIGADCDFVRHLFRRAPRDFPGTWPYDLASLSPPDRLTGFRDAVAERVAPPDAFAPKAWA